MVSINVKNATLQYRLVKKFSLRRSDTLVTDPRFKSSGRTSRVEALTNINLSLKPGDRLGLVGKNGSGKTTLLKMLYGVYPPSSGSVEVVGRTDALYNINLGFRPEATGRRNIELRGYINGWSPSQIQEKMQDIIDFSELGDFIDIPFKAYSQGMATRLAFSVATALDPEILLMDEWIGAGDKDFQNKAKQRMSEMADKAAIIVLASHNPDLLKKTCNKILELENGHIKSLSSVEEWSEK